MSSQIPPDPITNTFNPGAWDLPELPPAEQAVLDTKYVKYPTAQNSLITFPSSITTNGVTTPSVTSTGALDISLPSANILNVGVVASRNAIHHYSDGNNATANGSVHINNGTSNLSNTQIHNGTSSGGQVNIMTGTSSNGTVTIGNNNTLNTTTALKGTINIGIAGDAVTIGNISSSNTNITMGQIKTNKITANVDALVLTTTSGGGTIGIGNDFVNTGITIGNKDLRTSNISIGCGIGNTGSPQINIGNGFNSNTLINIGNGGGGALRGQSISIGATEPDTETSLGSLVTKVYGTLKSNTLDATAINSAQTIGSNVTTGSVGVGTAVTTGTIAIGPGGVNGLGNGGNVSIASGTSHVAGAYISVGSDALPYSYIRAQNIELNTNNSGNTNIGATTGGGIVSFYSPLTVGYTPSALTSSSMIGGRITSFPSTALALNQSTGSQVITTLTLPVGVWICSFQVQYNTSVSTTFTSTSTYMFISTPISGESLIYGSNRNFVSQTTTPSNILILSGSGTIRNTTSQTLSLVDESRYTTASGTLAVNNPSTHLIATRIG